MALDEVVEEMSPIAVNNGQAVQGLPGLQHQPGTKIHVTGFTEGTKADVSELTSAN
jgi:hypothetical protein